MPADKRGRILPRRLRYAALADAAVRVVDELDEDRLRVADERQIDRIVSSDPVGVDVELEERLVGAQPRVPVERRRLVQRRADREDDVGPSPSTSRASAWPAKPRTPSEKGGPRGTDPCRGASSPRARAGARRASAGGPPRGRCRRRSPRGSTGRCAASGPRRALHRAPVEDLRLRAICARVEPLLAKRPLPDVDGDVEVTGPAAAGERLPERAAQVPGHALRRT